MHYELKTSLFGFCRELARDRWKDYWKDATHLVGAGPMLSPGPLTIGFARRFATYKRASLLFRDEGRLRRLLTERHHPVQLVFAGKAHPADNEAKHILQLARTKGDPVRGEAVYRRAELGCFQCHALGGVGGNVGPDLSGIGTSAPMEYLLESVVLPSKIIREGFTTVTIFTDNGQLLTGVLVRETPNEMVLREPTRPDEIVIKTEDIAEKKIGGSLMPDRLDQSLSDDEVADLVRFLSELGKPGPFGVIHVPVARRWQKLAALPAEWKDLDDATLGKNLHDGAGLVWSTVYTRVSGDLPLDELGIDRIAVLRTQLQVVTPGQITLRLPKAALKLWVDGKPAAAAEKTVLSLDRGAHTLTIQVERADPRMNTFRVELGEVAGSKAAAQFVHGK